ncbi:hypothetical protein B0J13DRAFT_461143, partial [Dactylonectria estremocensis]
AFETLGAIYDLGKRRRYQAVWTSLVGFIVHSNDEGTLEEMGLELSEDQNDDILDVKEEVWKVDLKAVARRREKGGFDNVWVPIQRLLFNALSKPRSTAQNNPLVWWLAVLVRSAISNEKDFISSGRFNKNPMPMDVDIEGRLQAMVHYSKVLVLDDAFLSWSENSEWVMEVQRDLNLVDMEWINDENGARPEDSTDERSCSSAACQAILVQVKKQVEEHLGGKKGAAMHWAQLLAEEMGS